MSWVTATNSVVENGVMTVISADVPDEIIDELDDRVDWRRESRSAHIRDALRLWNELENPREMLDDKCETAG